ncbi:hypothetical protein TNCV_4429971 [Trichonephila clavipes]|nr:hypothetical protein TNCV_4429971 [Trichonephila clavipes]
MNRIYDAQPSNIRPFMDRTKRLITEFDLPNVDIQQCFAIPTLEYASFPLSTLLLRSVIVQRIFTYPRSQYSGPTTQIVRNGQITMHVES